MDFSEEDMHDTSATSARLAGGGGVSPPVPPPTPPTQDPSHATSRSRTSTPSVAFSIPIENSGKQSFSWKPSQGKKYAKAYPAEAPSAAPAAADAAPPYNDPRDYGYVFVLLGNLKEIVCDTWLGASGASLDARHLQDFPRDAVEVIVSLKECPRTHRKKSQSPKGVGQEEEVCGRMFTYEPWPANRPKPYTVSLSRKHHGETENYIAEIERYVRIAARDCYRRWPLHKMRKNVCPLIATSLLGTGYGGNYRKTGEMVKRLLPRLYALADELRVDVAIVTIEEEVFALTNSVKKQFLDQQAADSALYRTINGSRYLTPPTLDKLRFLAAQAMRGELTLFVGAGASMGVGIPNWANLLNIVAEKLGIEGDDFTEFSSLDYYTKAAVLESRLKRLNERLDAEERAADSTGGGKTTPPKAERSARAGGCSQRGTYGFGPYFDAVGDFLSGNVPDASSGNVRPSGRGPAPERLRTLGQYVARETQSQYYSIVDALLASLPCKEMITTNYDDLLEKAWSYSGQYSVLPYVPLQGCKRWLLKMHGTVTHPDEIVLSKRDYMRYHDRFAAMAGIVQSTLLTRHLLFVGFSLDDDNFQRIFDSVRKARQPSVADMDLTSPSANSYLQTKQRQKKMFDKASRLLKQKAKYPIYGPESEEEADDEYSEVCGTALMLEYSPLKGEIWDGDIDLVYLQERSEKAGCAAGKSDFDRLARLQEIFLDVLSSRCSQCGHIKFIFNDRYEDALTSGEKEFKACMMDFERQLQSLSQESKDTRAFQYFQKSMRKMGF